MSEQEVEQVIQAVKTESAAGMDGIPYKLWKVLAIRHKVTHDKDEEALFFNIVQSLTIVFHDIQEKGVDANSNFTLGWMCPIYKKHKQSTIENYRPITLLNLDYKILTVTNCLFDNPRVVGSSLSHMMGRARGEAQLYSGEYKRIFAVGIYIRRYRPRGAQ